MFSLRWKKYDLFRSLTNILRSRWRLQNFNSFDYLIGFDYFFDYLSIVSSLLWHQVGNAFFV